jgi:uncharacterized protein (TIGR00290 family)
MHKVWMSWSTGKDSAFALYQLLNNKKYKITGLLTTVTSSYNRVSMHATRNKLLQLQAESLDLPLHTVKIPKDCSDEIYKNRMAKMLTTASEISHIAFGDIFLSNIRQYREQQLKKTTIQPLFPLWHQPSITLAKQIINAGFKAIITCVDTKKISANLIGHEYNLDFIQKLPKDIDPCGENGEFHTFVYDAPIFSAPINIKTGMLKQYNEFVYIDVMC